MYIARYQGIDPKAFRRLGDRQHNGGAMVTSPLIITCGTHALLSCLVPGS